MQKQNGDQYHITVRSPERSYIEYTRMSSPARQQVFNLVAILPIRRGTGLFQMFRCWNIVLLTAIFFMWQSLLF